MSWLYAKRNLFIGQTDNIYGGPWQESLFYTSKVIYTC